MNSLFIMTVFLSTMSASIYKDTLPAVEGLKRDSVQVLLNDNSDSVHAIKDSLHKDTSTVNPLPDSSKSTPDSISIPVDTVLKKSVVKVQRKRRTERVSSDNLYPGISKEQDKLAMQFIHEVYSFNWGEADKIGMRMEKLETKSNLPPLSSLLMVSMRIVRIQNSEYATDSIGQHIAYETDSLINTGLKKSDSKKADSLNRLTYLFIYSGIEGFSATLKISKWPVDAAIEGFGAFKKLERLTESDTAIKDAYLGLGIFYCALAKAPAFVRGALNMTGREISFEKGLDYLRISAYQGRYTTETAKQYLIQFLSPYLGHETIEKNKVFRSLEQQYPKNPFYLFHHLHEDLCFHQESITKSYVDNVRKKAVKFKPVDYSITRYLTLLNYQYNFLDSGNRVTIDTTVKLREFSFYPVFLDALKERDSLPVKRERYKKMNLTATGIHAAKLLDESGMTPNRKNFFMWYLRDALRVKKSKNNHAE
ncbi:MAG: hypothetical protein ACM31E_06500 [Fibrobacterota bacterium]|nr:hypothetical protein [Chitinispirillaceae bacterium]